jgi:hypothetical protein
MYNKMPLVSKVLGSWFIYYILSELVTTSLEQDREATESSLFFLSFDTRCHVATTTVEQLIDYCMNTPRDPLRTAACVQQRIALIDKNLKLLKR